MTKSLGMRKSNSAISKSEEEERSHLIPTELDLSIVHLILTLIGKKNKIGSIKSYMIRTL